MRHRRRAYAIAFVACTFPTLLAAQSSTSADTAKVSAWATGGATADGKPATAGIPYWQAPALPAAVIQGGTIPAGWQPQPLAYQGVGPDGRVMTQYFAPTYTFTYQAGPPVLAVPQPAAVNRRQVPVYRGPQTYGAAPAPYAQVPYPVPPPAAGVPPSTVTRYAPPPVMPLAPPAAPPGWGPSAMPPPPATTAPPSAAAGWAAAVPAATAATVAAAAPPPTAALGGAPGPADATPALQAMTGPVAPAGTAAGMQPVNQPSLWRVVGVQDGDTVSCLDDLNQQRKVALADIDAPELGQAYGKQAREALAGMVFGRTVEVSNVAVDSAGNPTARLFAGGVDVSRQMVATGYAWQDPASQDRSLGTAQSQAKAAQLGLWADAAPTPPWTFRGSGSQ